MSGRKYETNLLGEETTEIPTRHKLLSDRTGTTSTVDIGGKRVYFQVNDYPSGKPGEVFIRIDKEGSELRVYDCLAIAISIGLQHGIPVETFVNKFKHQKMEPAGFTSNPDIPNAESIIDYLAKWLEGRYCSER